MRYSVGCLAVRDWLQAREVIAELRKSKNHRGRSEQRPYIKINSRQPGLAALLGRAQDKESVPPKGGPYVVSECLQVNKVYETGEVWDTSYR